MCYFSNLNGTIYAVAQQNGILLLILGISLVTNPMKVNPLTVLKVGAAPFAVRSMGRLFRQLHPSVLLFS